MQYSKIVMDHFKNPHNQGVIKNADGVGETGNPMCGDMMKVYIKVKDDKIIDIKFETLGCAAAIACSSILTDMAKGQPLEKAKNISKADIVKKLGNLPTSKIHCSVLAHEALAEAIYNYQSKVIN
ncbi:iron-sulfur cluster assembly scaffold protein [Patescibacteria group bacterium]|nr:iron-sulfur cluster assembly scaffold protein [Patescibacteria group bacterium]